MRRDCDGGVVDEEAGVVLARRITASYSISWRLQIVKPRDASPDTPIVFAQLYTQQLMKERPK